MVKFSSNDIFWILLFLYYSFGVEKTNTFIRSRGSLENDTRGQNLYPFSDQNSSKTIPFGAAHTYIAYIGEYPPGKWRSVGVIRGRGGGVLLQNRLPNVLIREGRSAYKHFCSQLLEGDQSPLHAFFSFFKLN